jgi:hypothetical protein
MEQTFTTERELPEFTRANVRQPLRCFIILCLSMFVNLILAFLHARGMPVSSGTIMAFQALITLAAVPAFFSRRVKFRQPALMALAFIVVSAIVMNLINPFNIKTIYDSVLIPIYIALGMSALYIRPRWMHYLLGFVVVITLIENFFPQVYVAIFDPAGYFSATREWVANQRANAAAADGFYTGAYRGVSMFSFTDHRMSGPFLEPISLGYFAFIMSTYYAGLFRGSAIVRAFAIVICLGLALSADSRIPTVLILLSTTFLTLRLKPPVIVLWLTFPVVMAVVFYVYNAQFSFLYGDTFDRISLTFEPIQSAGFGELFGGMISLDRVGDSGIIYLIRSLGLLGMPVAIWWYSGAYVYRRGTNASFFIFIGVYLTFSLFFGGASLSIKTASLLGYLIGHFSTEHGMLLTRRVARVASSSEELKRGQPLAVRS